MTQKHSNHSWKLKGASRRSLTHTDDESLASVYEFESGIEELLHRFGVYWAGRVLDYAKDAAEHRGASDEVADQDVDVALNLFCSNFLESQDNKILEQRALAQNVNSLKLPPIESTNAQHLPRNRHLQLQPDFVSVNKSNNFEINDENTNPPSTWSSPIKRSVFSTNLQQQSLGQRQVSSSQFNVNGTHSSKILSPSLQRIVLPANFQQKSLSQRQLLSSQFNSNSTNISGVGSKFIRKLGFEGNDFPLFRSCWGERYKR